MSGALGRGRRQVLLFDFSASARLFCGLLERAVLGVDVLEKDDIGSRRLGRVGGAGCARTKGQGVGRARASARERARPSLRQRPARPRPPQITRFIGRVSCCAPDLARARGRPRGHTGCCGGAGRRDTAGPWRSPGF